MIDFSFGEICICAILFIHTILMVHYGKKDNNKS